MSRATMPAPSSKSNAPVRATKAVEFFLIMDGLLARRSDANVVSSKSKICTFMISVMKPQAASSKPGFLSSKSRSSLATKIGRCSVATPISNRKLFTTPERDGPLHESFRGTPVESPVQYLP